MPPGAFVRVLFPTREKPREPGLLHIGYVLGGTQVGIIVAYTTSQPWPADLPLAAGVRLFTASEAAALNQSRPFILRLDVLAKLPLTPVWFPDIGREGKGVIAVAPARLREELMEIATNLVRRRSELLEMRGI